MKRLKAERERMMLLPDMSAMIKLGRVRKGSEIVLCSCPKIELRSTFEPRIFKFDDR